MHGNDRHAIGNMVAQDTLDLMDVNGLDLDMAYRISCSVYQLRLEHLADGQERGQLQRARVLAAAAALGLPLSKET